MRAAVLEVVYLWAAMLDKTRGLGRSAARTLQVRGQEIAAELLACGANALDACAMA